MFAHDVEPVKHLVQCLYDKSILRMEFIDRLIQSLEMIIQMGQRSTLTQKTTKNPKHPKDIFQKPIMTSRTIKQPLQNHPPISPNYPTHYPPTSPIPTLTGISPTPSPTTLTTSPNSVLSSSPTSPESKIKPSSHPKTSQPQLHSPHLTLPEPTPLLLHLDS